MSWNPKSGIGMFEQGCIQCACCGWRPEDGWDDSPEGFDFVQYGDLGGQWECDDCQEKSKEPA